MSRVRRSTVKSIDYAREQDFSDEDLFEDQDDSSPAVQQTSTTTTTKRRGRPKKSSSAVEHEGNAAAPDDFYQPDLKPRFFEKGYDMNLPHIRDRFAFMPELEIDGSPKLELIVGRRLIDSGEDQDGDSAEEDETLAGKKKQETKNLEKKHHAEYEYLIKYKGVSYLHLDWKAAGDLESMSKSGKNLYRRYLKKLKTSLDDELESPEVDASYIQPQKVIDQDEHELIVEISDEELAAWEKEALKKSASEMSDDDDDDDDDDEMKQEPKISGVGVNGMKNEVSANSPGMYFNSFIFLVLLAIHSGLQKTLFIADEEFGEPGTLGKEDIKKILSREGSYYPVVEGSDNPYRDGYVTEPPKKPRASYLFFQGVYRSVYQKRNPGASVGHVMSLLGDTWRNLSDDQQSPFIELAQEEVVEYEKKKVLLEKAQRPNGLWQPIRRCRMVLERLAKDTFANIFLDPVELREFPDYMDMEYVDSPMDLATVRQKLKTKKYQGPENFARDMRKVRYISFCCTF